MRRRTFLTAAAAGAVATAPSSLTACSQARSKKHPAPTPPPAPDAVPSAFADRPTWPTAENDTRLTAARDRYLCGGAVIDEARRIFTEGWCPVVVDVSTLTTRAVLLDKDGSWITKEVEMVFRYDEGDDPKTALTTIVIGPALLDEEHAYLVVGAITLSEPDPNGVVHYGPPDGATCPVAMFKIRLSDGAIAASTTVSDQLPAESIEDMHLSFSTDAASLLLAAGTGDASAETDHVGLRLSAEDLSIQLDVRSVLEGKRAHSTSCGQAVGVTYTNTPGRLIVFLADGSQEPADDTDMIMVRDGWYYYKKQDETSSRGYARDLGSGQTVELSPGWEKDITLGSWPSIASDQQEIIALDRNRNDTGTLTVRNPGAPSIVLSQKRVEGAGILGDVLYTSYDPDDSDSTSTDHLVLTSVSTGETITERDEEMGLSGRAVVTPWGLADYDSFYAATEWLDSVPTPASPSSSPSSPVTPTAPRPTPTAGTGPS